MSGFSPFKHEFSPFTRFC